MRKILVITFMSMDGVLQAPGGPDEDRTNGFKWGGWMFHFGDDVSNQFLGEIFQQPFDLLLGRRTYDIFSAFWPYQKDHPIGKKFDSVEKYVVASKAPDMTWENSTLITGDVVTELKKLKQQDGPLLLVHGSSRLIQTLLQHNLVDQLNIWIHPVTLGSGKKLFEEGTQAMSWKLTDSKVSTTGVILATYEPNGDVKPGSFPSGDISEKEKVRQEKVAKGKW